MRKPSRMPLRMTSFATMALLSSVACDKSPAIDSQPASSLHADDGSGFASASRRERVTPLGATAIVASNGPIADGAPGMPVDAPRAPESRAKSASSAVDAASRADVPHGTPLPSLDLTGAMLVRHGSASLQVKAVDAALPSVRQIAAQFGGFVANTNVRAGKDEQRSATLELRVPSDKFDALLSALSGLGKVESVTATAEDVAEEYVDLGARAANARRVEARLVEMLATRTGKLSDVLTVEQELSRVRQETERYDARLRWLERRATLSSLDITIHETIPLIESQPGPGPIVEAFAEAWTRMVAVLAWCIASLGVLVPLAVLFGLGAFIARRALRGTGKAGDLLS